MYNLKKNNFIESPDDRDSRIRREYTERTKKEKDPFLEGFNDPYGEKKKEIDSDFVKKNIRENLFRAPQSPIANISEPKDQFLEGFNQAHEEEKAWKRSLESAKEKVDGVVKGFVDTAKKAGEAVVNTGSSSLNKLGVLDNVTNTLFKTHDLAQGLANKTLPIRKDKKALIDENYAKNQALDLSVYEDGYINDQNISKSTSGKIKYGTGTFNENGCGVIAANNALVSLGNRKDVRDLAKEFETDGQVFGGFFGTSPYAIGDYFRNLGYDVTTYEGDKKIYNLDIPDADTYIASFWNSDKAMDMIHTVAIDKLDSGKYRIYNENGRNVKDVNNLNNYFGDYTRVPLVLHCIKKGK